VNFRGILGLAIAAGLAAPPAFRGQGPIEPRQKAGATPKQAAPNQNDEPRVNLRVDSTLVLVPSR
jgi:hypothetical protein